MLKEMLKTMVAVEAGVGIADVMVMDETTVQRSLLVEIRKTEGNANICFCTHIDFEMAEDRTIKELAQEIAESFRDSMWAANLDKKTVLSRAFISVVNANSNRELLEQVPFRKVLDLAAVPSLEADTRRGKSTVKISKNTLASMGISEDELFKAAYANSLRIKKYRFGTMESFLSGTAADLGEDLLHEAQSTIGLCVLTSGDGRNGAGAICFPELIDKCARMMKSDILIIPSSIHELMMMPILPWIDADELRMMVRSFNGSGTVVRPEDVLSNNVYRYSRKTKRIGIA